MAHIFCTIIVYVAITEGTVIREDIKISFCEL
jgi:hypothetical protein